MFEIPHATNICSVYTIQWWVNIVSRDHSDSVQRLCCILLVWWVFLNVSMIHNWCDGLFDHCFELFFELHHFLVRIFSVGLNLGLHDDKLFIRIVIHVVVSFWNIEAWGMKRSIMEVVKWLFFGSIWRRWTLMSKYPC